MKPSPCVVDRWQFDSKTDSFRRCFLAIGTMVNNDVITVTRIEHHNSFKKYLTCTLPYQFPECSMGNEPEPVNDAGIQLKIKIMKN